MGLKDFERRIERLEDGALHVRESRLLQEWQRNPYRFLQFALFVTDPRQREDRRPSKAFLRGLDAVGLTREMRDAIRVELMEPEVSRGFMDMVVPDEIEFARPSALCALETQ